MQMYTRTRLMTAIHRLLFSRFFSEGVGHLYTLKKNSQKELRRNCSPIGHNNTICAARAAPLHGAMRFTLLKKCARSQYMHVCWPVGDTALCSKAVRKFRVSQHGSMMPLSL